MIFCQMLRIPVLYFMDFLRLCGVDKQAKYYEKAEIGIADVKSTLQN
jgi:hypothetical protein